MKGEAEPGVSGWEREKWEDITVTPGAPRWQSQFDVFVQLWSHSPAFTEVGFDV